MADAGDRALRTARELARRMGVERHDVLVVLGTGLSAMVELLGTPDITIPIDTLPYFPRYSVRGHEPRGHSLVIAGRRILVFAGRCHLYEGLDPRDVVHPVRTGIAAGCTTVVLTAAVGAVRTDLSAGDVVAVADQLNLTGTSPLQGADYVDMVGAYSHELRKAAVATPGVGPLSTGVYAQVRGPQFETPAEIAALRTMGADVVGMSMALETIAARRDGADVLGLAVVTNAAAGSSPSDSDVAAIAQASTDAAPSVAAVVRHVITSLP
ncbi:MAG TPA: purine-nucleoside phosphorylase [Acidimicrobiales bacterium]|nr:purine-nucleoside phosphorylase [Acidimicrobiales bacterium]